MKMRTIATAAMLLLFLSAVFADGLAEKTVTIADLDSLVMSSTSIKLNGFSLDKVKIYGSFSYVNPEGIEFKVTAKNLTDKEIAFSLNVACFDANGAFVASFNLSPGNMFSPRSLFKNESVQISQKIFMPWTEFPRIKKISLRLVESNPIE